ncbi:MAG: hypothetical protein OXT71_04420 [Acidobacteriota bacterium]|nr:hypothetical protein [Acidobacteriota bacterium]
MEIDPSGRKVDPDEPDWIFRLRKVCLHTVAATKCPVATEGLHLMAVDLKAAYRQMHSIWRDLPDEFRLDADRIWWDVETKNGLSEYDHPTPLGLLMPLSNGGFSDKEEDNPGVYLRFAVWWGRLWCAYGLALDHLADLLGAEETVKTRLLSIALRANDEFKPTPTRVKLQRGP